MQRLSSAALMDEQITYRPYTPKSNPSLRSCPEMSGSEAGRNPSAPSAHSPHRRGARARASLPESNPARRIRGPRSRGTCPSTCPPPSAVGICPCLACKMSNQGKRRSAAWRRWRPCTWAWSRSSSTRRVPSDRQDVRPGAHGPQGRGLHVGKVAPPQAAVPRTSASTRPIAKPSPGRGQRRPLGRRRDRDASRKR